MSLTRILINSVVLGASVKIVQYNDSLREQVERGAIAWQPYMGYLSDIFVPMAIVSSIGVYASVINHFKRRRYDSIGRKQLENKLENLILGTALTTAVGFSLLEQINNFGNKATSGEFNDVICYFSGAGLGYLIYAVTDIFEKK